MQLLWPPYIIGRGIIFLSCGFFLHFFPRLISAVPDWMSTILFDTWCGPSANLECRSEMCCARFAGNAALKNRHLGSIAQLCRAISSQLRHVPTIGNKLVKQQYLLHIMPSQYGKRRPTSGWDLLASLGHPCKFQRVSRLGSVTARLSSSGRQPNFGRWTEGAIYIRQGGHHVWHWPTFLVASILLFLPTATAMNFIPGYWLTSRINAMTACSVWMWLRSGAFGSGTSPNPSLPLKGVEIAAFDPVSARSTPR